MKQYIPYLIAMIIFVLWQFDKCSLTRQISLNQTTIENYRDTAIFLSEYTAKNTALKTDNINLNSLARQLKKSNSKYADQIDYYKNISSITKIRTNISIDTIEFRFADTIPCVFERPVIIDSPHYKINQLFTNKFARINLIEFPDEQLIVVGDKKGGLFKPSAFEISVTHNNPHVVTTGIQNYTLQPKMPMAEIGVGVGYSYCLGSQSFSPTIGISIQKPLIILWKRVANKSKKSGKNAR